MGKEAGCGVRGAGTCEAWMRGLAEDLGAPGIVELLEAGEPPLEARFSTWLMFRDSQPLLTLSRA